jgi:hypothetical protein
MKVGKVKAIGRAGNREVDIGLTVLELVVTSREAALCIGVRL